MTNAKNGNSRRAADWRKVVSELNEQCASLLHRQQSLREKRRDMAARKAVGAPGQTVKAVEKVNADIIAVDQQLEETRDALSGAEGYLAEAEKSEAALEREARWKAASEIADERLKLASKLEKQIESFIAAFNELEEKGRAFHAAVPARDQWIAAAHPAYGDALLRDVKLAFLKAGLRLDSQLFLDGEQVQKAPSFKARSKELNDIYLSPRKGETT